MSETSLVRPLEWLLVSRWREKFAKTKGDFTIVDWGERERERPSCVLVVVAVA